MIKNNKLVAAVLGALCAMPVVALGQEVTSHKDRLHVIPEVTQPAVTGSVIFVSDYVFNGISQSYRAPAIQGGLDYALANGLYIGTWASSISGSQYSNASMELDIYGGYKGKVGADLAYDVGLITITYPGGKAYNSIDTTNNNLTSAYKRWDTAEVVMGATWKNLNAKLTYTLTDWFGINNGGSAPFMWSDNSSTADSTKTDLGSAGSTYIELNYTYEVSDSLKVIAHVGSQKVANFKKLDYTDYKIAISKSHKGFDFGLAFTTTNATDNSLYHVKANGDDKVLSGNIIAASVTRPF